MVVVPAVPPDPWHRHTAEFCDDGAKAVAEEATTDHLPPGCIAENTEQAMEQADLSSADLSSE